MNLGDPVPAGTTFTFELRLDEPGVRSYVQEALSAGALGFFFSSLHYAEQPGTAGAPSPYPQWDMTESVLDGGTGTPATLSIDYTLLSEHLPGDYDENGSVELADYEKWKTDFGMAVATGDGADGNSNGVIDAADYTVWRDYFGAAGSGSAAAISNALPEPGTLLLFGWLTTMLGAARQEKPPNSATGPDGSPPRRAC